jgi:ferric-dicitrate binding protein FerR (iron transport regulator)
MANEEIDWVALGRYLAGEASPQERELMRRRIPASPQLARSQAEVPAIRAVYATARGERAIVELRDGTRVTLTPETELRVAAIGRPVYLSGEAVFSVTHNPRQPFRVIAPNGVTVQDIGTRFDMRAWADKAVRVAVAAGSVSLRGSAQPITLGRGTLGVIDSAGTNATRGGPRTDIWPGRTGV